MAILQGAYSIFNQSCSKYLDAHAAYHLGDIVQGLQRPDFLQSAALRAQIWLIEKTTDGKNFRFRNYETGGVLDVQNSSIAVNIGAGNSSSQLWEVNWLRSSARGDIYEIKEPVTPSVLYCGSSGYTMYATVSSRRNQSAGEWLIQPVLVPTPYWLINSAVPALVLRMSSRPNAFDNTSRELALVPKDLSARNHLWTFEYTSGNESIIRNGSDNEFVLERSESAEDAQTLLARKRRGGSNQLWAIKDEDENNHVVSLANVATDTLLATRVRKLSGASVANTLVLVIEGNTRWQLLPSPRPPFFWVTIQNSRSGAFLTQTEDGSIVPSMGALYANDHSVQWRFIMLDKDLQYVIVNRATGFMLQYYANAVSEVSIVAESNDRNNAHSHWMLDSAGDTNVGIVNVGSKCVLDHYRGETIQACDPGTGYSGYSQWTIVPVYDNFPSFALVNSRTGRCIANSPAPGVGTVTTTNNINDFRSQWLFYHPISSIEPDPEYVLLNKILGHVLEYYEGSRIEAHDINCADPQQRWKLLPLRGRDFALVNTATQQFLYDPGDSSPTASDLATEDSQALCWHLASYRESGFDFISWDFDILQRFLADLPPQSSQKLQHVIAHRLPAGEKGMKGQDKTTHIPRATRVTRITNDKIRAIFTHLIGRLEGVSTSETSQPHTIASIDKKTVEEWGVSLSERPLRRRSDEPGWIRIDLQGVYEVGGSWLANIQGQWLEDPVFQIIIPVGVPVGQALIRRAMLQSLTEGLAIEIRATPPTHTPTTGTVGRPGAISRPQDIGADDGKMNSLALALDSIGVSSLKHDEL